MPKALTDAQVRSYHDNGFLSPVRAMSAERARAYRERLDHLSPLRDGFLESADVRIADPAGRGRQRQDDRHAGRVISGVEGNARLNAECYTAPESYWIDLK